MNQDCIATTLIVITLLIVMHSDGSGHNTGDFQKNF